MPEIARKTIMPRSWAGSGDVVKIGVTTGIKAGAGVSE